MTNDRRSTSRRFYYVSVASFITIMMAITALGAFDFASARQVGGNRPEMKVENIWLEEEWGNHVQGGLTVVANGVRVPNATVSMTLTYPDGWVDEWDQQTSRAGLLYFDRGKYGDGNYVLVVEDIQKSGYAYNKPSKNADKPQVVLTIGEAGNDNKQPPVQEPEEPIDEDEGEEPVEEPGTPPVEEPGDDGDNGDHHGGSGSMHEWHAPGSHDGLINHDHGDAPPQWVFDAGYTPGYDHPGMTPNENALKHTAMKGFTARMNGVDVYVIAHLDTHPNGQQTRFHSYQLWMRDPSGGVSHIHGWMDFGEGDNALPNVATVETCPNFSGVRPVIGVNFPECPVGFENWYSRAGGSGAHAPDFGFNLSAPYYGGPQRGTLSSGKLEDADEWIPTGRRNNIRRMEVAWYADRSNLRGEFWTDQWGRVLNGPNDARVGTTRTIGGRDYEVLALRQYIAPTAVSLVFPGNSVEKTYPMAEPYQLPN